MTRARTRRANRREQLLWVACGSLLLAGVAFVATSRPSSDAASRVLSTPPTTSPATPTTHTSLATTNAGQGLARSLPERLIIPALGISTSVSLLGLQANHQVQVPVDAQSVGWFRLGPTPGQLGSSVLLGHVDSYRGPGIFFRIKSLPEGSLVEVVLHDGVTGLFRVLRVVQYAKTGFPDALVYGASGSRLLNLVTCGGTFDHATGSYESNIVVFSRLVGVR